MGEENNLESAGVLYVHIVDIASTKKVIIIILFIKLLCENCRRLHIYKSELYKICG
jgi:hypothetical protein